MMYKPQNTVQWVFVKWKTTDLLLFLYRTHIITLKPTNFI